MAYLYRERRYYCGRYLEVDLFPVFPASKGRGKKKKPTSEIQNKLNERNAEMKLTRILNENFDARDVEIHLTFDDGNLPATDDEACRIEQNFIRRVKRLRKKHGLPEMKYVNIVEGSATGPRLHFHITMTGGLDRDELEALWPYGYANSRRLQFNENGVEGLARNFAETGERVPCGVGAGDIAVAPVHQGRVEGEGLAQFGDGPVDFDRNRARCAAVVANLQCA